MHVSPRQLFDNLLKEKPGLECCGEQLYTAYEKMRACFLAGGKLLLCGNGGSAADCEHIAGELMKGFLRKRPVKGQINEPSDGWEKLQGALPAIPLTANSVLMTAIANDTGPEMVFAQQVYGYGRSGDMLLGISTSGSAENVCRALKVGRALGLLTIGLTGRSGGRMAELCGITICVPEDETYRVQELHVTVYHTLCAMLEAAFFE